MKFASLSAFEKHLQDAAPDHLSSLYIVVAPVDFERRKIAETVAQAILPDTTTRFDGVEVPVQRVVDALNTLSLLGQRRLALLDNVDQLKRADLELLSAYLADPAPSTSCILMAASLKSHADLYNKARAEAVLLDLSGEKPWEREKRLSAHVEREATRAGKALEPGLAAKLPAIIGADMALLEQELLKLIAYVGSRPRITSEDVRVICCCSSSPTGWQLAEEIVWQTGPHRGGSTLLAGISFMDTSFLIGLLGPLRFHLQAGLQICEGTVPYHKPAQAERFLPLVRKWGSRYFKRGLKALFEMELALKSSGLAPDLLLDLFIGKLHHYAHPATQPSRS